MDEHLKKYCGTIKECVENPQDPPIVGFEQVHNKQKGKGTIQCPPGKVITSCGIRTLDSCDADKYWSVLPSGKDKCECYSKGCDECYATCVNEDANPRHIYYTAKSDGSNFKVNCPDGYKVTGCGMKGSTHYNSVYPGNDHSCTCSLNTVGTKCSATCSGNVVDHQIVTQYGEGTFDVMCPGNTFVLGCGFKQTTTTGKNYPKYPGFWPTDIQTCTCHYDHGMTCYAICGTIVSGTSSTTMNGTSSLSDALIVETDGILI